MSECSALALSCAGTSAGMTLRCTLAGPGTLFMFSRQKARPMHAVAQELIENPSHLLLDFFDPLRRRRRLLLGRSQLHFQLRSTGL